MKQFITLLIVLSSMAAISSCGSTDAKPRTRIMEGELIKEDSLTGQVLGMDTACSNKNAGNYGYTNLVVMTNSLRDGEPDTLLIPLSGMSAVNLLNTMQYKSCSYDKLQFVIRTPAQCTIFPFDGKVHYIQVKYSGGNTGNPNNGPDINFF